MRTSASVRKAWEHRRLAYKTAYKMYRTNALVRRLGSLEDLKQEAFLALLNAARHYDQEGPATFSNYATVAIRNRLLDAACAGGLVRVPKAYLQERHRSGSSKETLERAMKGLLGPLPMGNDTYTIPDRERQGRSPEQTRLEQSVRKAVASLAPKLRKTMEARFGLNCRAAESRQEQARRRRVPYGTIANWLRKGTKLLKEALEGEVVG